MAVEKSVVRQHCITQRHALDPVQRDQASRAIVSLLTQLPEYSTSKIVGLYAASHGEAELHLFFDRCVADGKACYFPRLEGHGLVFHRVCNWADLAPAEYGILAPQGNSTLLDPEHCDLMVVPGVAFDRRGNRLGRGKGFYDRYLPKVGGCRIGVCLNKFIIEDIPHEPHDVRMDLLVTESGVMRF